MTILRAIRCDAVAMNWPRRCHLVRRLTSIDSSLLLAKASRRRAKLSQMKSETSHEGSSQLVMCRAVGLRETKTEYEHTA